MWSKFASLKFLVTIKTDVPIETNLDELSRREANTEALRPIYEELEFRSSSKRWIWPLTPLHRLIYSALCLAQIRARLRVELINRLTKH